MRYSWYIKVFIAFCFIFITSHFSIAQYGSVQGEVTNSFDEPEFSVIIRLDGENRCRTDIDGTFTIDSIPIGQHVISVVSHIYRTDTIEVQIQVEEGKLLKIDLE